jgi:hypothetical protein
MKTLLSAQWKLKLPSSHGCLVWGRSGRFSVDIRKTVLQGGTCICCILHDFLCCCVCTSFFAFFFISRGCWGSGVHHIIGKDGLASNFVWLFLLLTLLQPFLCSFFSHSTRGRFWSLLFVLCVVCGCGCCRGDDVHEMISRSCVCVCLCT